MSLPSGKKVAAHFFSSELLTGLEFVSTGLFQNAEPPSMTTIADSETVSLKKRWFRRMMILAFLENNFLPRISS